MKPWFDVFRYALGNFYDDHQDFCLLFISVFAAIMIILVFFSFWVRIIFAIVIIFLLIILLFIWIYKQFKFYMNEYKKYNKD